MRLLLAVAAALLVAGVASAAEQPVRATPNTEIRLIHYRAHDGQVRPAWLLLPAGYHGQRIPLVITPHGRGVDETDNALFWGDLPGEGDFALIDPAGEGRRLHWYSWGAPGQIADLARMPAIARACRVNVDRRRIYAFGGSMGGQETLLLLARHPHLLAGAAAFDPATDMARRYRDFAALPHGRRAAGACPRARSAERRRRYRRRTRCEAPTTTRRRSRGSGVPLQLYWSPATASSVTSVLETNELAIAIDRDDEHERLWDFEGDWSHTAEMRWNRRLPRALARFGLLPWQDAPAVPATRSRLA